MQKDALLSLEWNQVLNWVADQARSFPAREALLGLMESENWAPTSEIAKGLQAETAEAFNLLEREGLWAPLDELTDPSESTQRLRRGAVLEVVELGSILRWARAVDAWSLVPREEIRGERFLKTLDELPDVSAILRALRRVLSEDGEISETASPRLGQLFSEIRSLQREIRIVLDQMVKTYSTQGVLQENFTDVRDGRYVIPVKISHQNDIDGIIYEASASRQTVFVEPREVAHLNNRLRQRQNDLTQEIFKVLEATSRELMPFADAVDLSVELLTRWDSTAAKARWGDLVSARPITLSDARRFEIKSTAHPLLWLSLSPQQIIKNDIVFGEPERALLLTGPNTGGKTVFLKTLGIAALCARTGLPIPAIGQPEVPFFDQVFVDLGDSQSIEAHLSSFSGHVAKFREILEDLTPRSLVLLDELNSATDPEEGAALGRAFLETLMKAETMIVSTTHDPHLKALAATDPRILNASMAFDEKARTPTYAILIGVLGRSRALETAERLGIPKEVIALARSYLSQEHREFEGTLSSLEQEIATARQARIDAEASLKEAKKLEEKWSLRIEERVSDLLENAQKRLRKVVDSAQDEARATILRLEEARSRKDVMDERASLHQTLDRAGSEILGALSDDGSELSQLLKPAKNDQPKAEIPEALAPLKPGDWVRVPKWKSTGQIVAILGSQFKIALGAIQMTLGPNEIQRLEPGEKRVNHGPRNSTGLRPSSGYEESESSKLDVRGVRFEEAMFQIEKFVDHSYRSTGRAQITIVHGLGTGALREGTRKFLKRLPYVKTFGDGAQGGPGATDVEFDR
jgi:DNA mismatch repair protein MutS2